MPRQWREELRAAKAVSLDALAYVLACMDEAHKAEGNPRRSELGQLWHEVEWGQLGRELQGRGTAPRAEVDLALAWDGDRVLGYRGFSLVIVKRELRSEALQAAWEWLPEDALRAQRLLRGGGRDVMREDDGELLPLDEDSAVDLSRGGAGALVRLHTYEGVLQVTTIREGGEVVFENEQRVYRRYTYDVWVRRDREGKWICGWPQADESYCEPRNYEARQMGLTAL